MVQVFTSLHNLLHLHLIDKILLVTRSTREDQSLGQNLLLDLELLNDFH